ncbi:CaiB/BaiF CoA transferase family protein [Marinobacterium rhizophilum]|uniref:CoA transferase n=1 Tax=Marinobacterium rhizophilum TaxID=420402 RepID=A0ABY5HHX9_9GAMM|nr:CoA transferase [Marinobacterium rhizophilum]UTW11968.1 CoA transferase [Marinobacterium rhizophilum]
MQDATQKENSAATPTGPLSGIRVLDLSRILAAPACTQILGDLGADIIKVERPMIGDDIRKWGPPFLKDEEGNDTTESGYYLSTGRNKRSISIDFSKAEGREILLGLIAQCDVLVENYKVGSLKKLGLDYDTLRDLFPGIIYCSITGYGQDGPYSARPGYDMVAQALGGLISIIGEEGRPPAKVPIAVDDIMTGMYACIGILSALRHRDQTGIGQQIDLALLDVQIAWLYNQGVNYFLDGEIPKRMGTGHPNIVPYQIFEASDGYILLGAVNNDQFAKLCNFVGRPDLLERNGFKNNKERVRNRAVVNAAVSEFIATQTVNYWVEELSKIKLTCSKVNNIAEALSDPQVLSRGMHIKMEHPLAGAKPVDLIASPLNLSETPVNYRHAPPTLGQHTDDILAEFLDFDENRIAELRNAGIL